jgi:hypothetical protein
MSTEPCRPITQPNYETPSNIQQRSRLTGIILVPANVRLGSHRTILEPVAFWPFTIAAQQPLMHIDERGNGVKWTDCSIQCGLRDPSRNKLLPSRNNTKMQSANNHGDDRLQPCLTAGFSGGLGVVPVLTMIPQTRHAIYPTYRCGIYHSRRIEWG